MKNISTYASAAILMAAAGSVSADILTVSGTVVGEGIPQTTLATNAILEFYVEGTWDTDTNDLNLTYDSDVQAWFPGNTTATPDAGYSVLGSMTYAHSLLGGSFPTQTLTIDNSDDNVNDCTSNFGTDFCATPFYPTAPGVSSVTSGLGIGMNGSHGGEKSLVATATDLDFVFEFYDSGRDANYTYVFDIQEVPVPAAAWLFGSALVGLAGIGRRRSK